jgi:hypothetical protein
MKITERTLRSGCAAACGFALITSLAGCGLGGMSGPFPGVPDLHGPGHNRSQPVEIAAPQVAYRIDENRYFEIVPYGPGACTNAMVHFVDKAKGIRSEAVKLDRGSMLRATLVIDASNDQYLVAPVTRGNTDCSSGGGLCGGSKLPYSTDGGKTWKRAEAPSPDDAIHLKGSLVRSLGVRDLASTIDLANGTFSLKDWKYEPNYVLSLAKAPIDTKLHCTVNGKE